MTDEQARELLDEHAWAAIRRGQKTPGSTLTNATVPSWTDAEINLAKHVRSEGIYNIVCAALERTVHPQKAEK